MIEYPDLLYASIFLSFVAVIVGVIIIHFVFWWHHKRDKDEWCKMLHKGHRKVVYIAGSSKRTRTKYECAKCNRVWEEVKAKRGWEY